MTVHRFPKQASTYINHEQDGTGRQATSRAKIVSFPGNGLRGAGRGGAAAVRLDRDFPDLWSGWLRHQFRRPEDVAAAYGVTFSTARNWWDGLTAPRAHHVAAEALADPAFVDFLRGKLGVAA